jgi:hypothetical protein
LGEGQGFAGMRYTWQKSYPVAGVVMAKKGCFIRTDISGYTEFPTGSELDHALDGLCPRGFIVEITLQ